MRDDGGGKARVLVEFAAHVVDEVGGDVGDGLVGHLLGREHGRVCERLVVLGLRDVAVREHALQHGCATCHRLVHVLAGIIRVG